MKTFYDLFFIDFATILTDFLNRYLPKLGEETNTENWWKVYVECHLSQSQKRSLQIHPGFEDMDIAALLKIAIGNWDSIIPRFFNHNAAFGIKACLLELKKGRNSISHVKSNSPVTKDLVFRYLDCMDRIAGLICPEDKGMQENCCKLKLQLIPQLQMELMDALASLSISHTGSGKDPGTLKDTSTTIVIGNSHYIELEGILLPKLKKEFFQKMGLKSWAIQVDENGTPLFAGPKSNFSPYLKTLSLLGQAKSPENLMIDFHNNKGCHAIPEIPCRIQTVSKKTFKLFNVDLEPYHALLQTQEKYTWVLSKNDMIIGRTDTNDQNAEQADIRLDFLHHPESMVWEEDKKCYGVSLNMLQLSRRHVKISNQDGNWHLSRLCNPNSPIYILSGERDWIPLTHSTQYGDPLDKGDKFIIGYYLVSLKET